LKRKSSTRLGGYLGSFQGWKLNLKREGNAQTKPIIVPKVVESSFNKNRL
jgi:hypothetical protein